MRVFITGVAGNIGRHTAEHLVSYGYAVKGVDRRGEVSIPGIEYAVCDVTDVAALRQEMRGCDAALHLAAITLPWRAPSHEIFRINDHGTYCVYQAAASLGVKRVVCASSINALGCWFGNTFPPIYYLPIDEAHPTYTTDIYSFSKGTMEEVAAYFWRREGISSVCLCMGGRMRLDPRPLKTEIRRTVLRLIDLPGGRGRRQVAEWLTGFFAHRRLHPSEGRVEGDPIAPAGMDDVAGRIVHHVAHFWTAFDIRDRAQAVEKALAADFEGSHTLFINDSHNCLGVDSTALAELCYPNAARKRELKGTESLISIDRAQQLIGFESQYSVSRYFDTAE